MLPFAVKFVRGLIADWRSLAGLVALVVAVGQGASGLTFVFPTWMWLSVTAASAYAVLFSSEWKRELEQQAAMRPDMGLFELVERIIGSADTPSGEAADNAGAALLVIRERANLGDITVWGRRDVKTRHVELYPLSRIRRDYWDYFWISYDSFTNNPLCKSELIRAAPGCSEEYVDSEYCDFHFCAYEVGKVWPAPKQRLKFRWPVTWSAAT